MPIYEFYCADCHTIFNFLSRRVDTEKRPPCPRCGQAQMQRRVSLFNVSKGRKETEEGALGDVDEARMEQVLASMASEMEGLDENDPRQAARLMRKLYDATGLKVGPGIEEAIRRMEAGEDPEQIETEMGDVLEAEDPFSLRAGTGLKALRQQFLPPRTDDTLYEL
jgi:putative FmdB family regulatory protein